MKILRNSVIIIILVVIAIAIAGCASTTPSSPTTGATQTTTIAAGTPVGTTSAPATGSVVSGADIFGSSAASYNWIEYKTSSSGMTIYIKYEKSGKCTMRMEGAGVPGGSMTQDCSVTGGQTRSNPNAVTSDVQYTFVGIEPVSVPAGTYPAASKYTSTVKGITTTFWTAPGVPGFVKMVSGDATMELNGWG